MRHFFVDKTAKKLEKEMYKGIVIDENGVTCKHPVTMTMKNGNKRCLGCERIIKRPEERKI